jgi:hypothetical protein
MKEELHYGYKKVIYPNGIIKYYNITGEAQYYKEINKKQADKLEAKVIANLSKIRKLNQDKINENRDSKNIRSKNQSK